MDRETVCTYNQAALAYNLETADFWDGFPKSFIKYFKDWLPRNLAANIGSGPGRDACLLQEAGINLICLDASLTMASLTKKRALRTVQADFSELPFLQNRLPGAWAYTSLIHIPKSELPKALQEIKGSLQTLGVLALGVIEGQGEGYETSSGISLPRYFARYTESEILDILKAVGFPPFYVNEYQPHTRRYLNILSRKSL